MRLNPVDSSVLAQVGYDPDLKHLRAVMKDGSTYDVAPVFVSEFAEFMAAPSKGIYWHRVFAARAYRSGEGKEGAEKRAGERSGVGAGGMAPLLSLKEPQPGEPLDTFEPDSCCGAPLQKAARSGVLKAITSWECPKCGCEWKPTQHGPLRHWTPNPAIMILRV